MSAHAERSPSVAAHLIPEICWNHCAPIPSIVRRKFCDLPWWNSSFIENPVELSIATASQIPRKVCCTFLSSTDVPSRAASTANASSYRPLDASHRGDSHKRKRYYAVSASSGLQSSATYDTSNHDEGKQDLDGDGETPRDLPGRIEESEINPVGRHDSLQR